MAEMSDDVKRQALEQAQGAKAAMKVDSLQPQEASSADVDRGPTTLPGETPGYGKNFNRAEPMPERQPSMEPEREAA